MQFSEWNWQLLVVIAAFFVLSIVLKRRKRRGILRRMEVMAQTFGASLEREDEVRYRIDVQLDGRDAAITYGAYIESAGPPRKLPRWRLTCTIPLTNVPDVYDISFRPSRKKDGTYRRVSSGFEPREGALDGRVHDAVSAWSTVAGSDFTLHIEAGKLIARSDELVDAGKVFDAAQLQARVARELELALSR